MPFGVPIQQYHTHIVHVSAIKRKPSNEAYTLSVLKVLFFFIKIHVSSSIIFIAINSTFSEKPVKKNILTLREDLYHWINCLVEPTKAETRNVHFVRNLSTDINISSKIMRENRFSCHFVSTKFIKREWHLYVSNGCVICNKSR